LKVEQGVEGGRRRNSNSLEGTRWLRSCAMAMRSKLCFCCCRHARTLSLFYQRCCCRIISETNSFSNAEDTPLPLEAFPHLGSMFKSCLIVLGIVAAASAIPVPALISDALMVNVSSGYNPGAAVAYAKANCNSGQGLCAEFASRSMAAGGAGNPVITWVPDLVNVRPCVRLL
jgi:hypothetical protein